MKTRRAIFWATLAVINTLTGLQADGFMRYVITTLLAVCVFMLWRTTRERMRIVNCVRCGNDLCISEEGVTRCACGVKHTWRHSD